MTWRARDRVDRLELPATQKAVLSALAGYAREPDLVAWPSLSTLAGVVGVTDRTVRRTLRALEAAGWIEAIERGGGRRTTRYRVVLDRPEGGQDVLSGGTQCPGSGDTVSPERVIEPINELGAEAPEPEEDRMPDDVSQTAQEITRAWWDARNPKPVGTFVAARSRVKESLVAGWTAPEVARALRTFGYVPDRAALVRKLETIAQMDRARASSEDEATMDYEHNRRATDSRWSSPW